MEETNGRLRLWAVILAGGAGRRVASVVRRLEGHGLPKQFCRFGGSRSFLQETVDRLDGLVPEERVVVVVSAPHMAIAQAQLADRPAVTLLVQPVRRGTAPGLLLPVSHVHRRAPDATVVVLPTDHGIEDRQLFQSGIHAAHQAVVRSRFRLIVGAVSARCATTDYGWIVPECVYEGGSPAVLPVREFIEKPADTRAIRLFERGGLWSTFNLVARSRTVLEAYDRCLPDLARLFRSWASISPMQADEWLRRKYMDIPTTDFSTSVLARAHGLGALCWPNEIGWTDLGTSKRLYEWLRRAEGTRRADEADVGLQI